MPKSMHYVEKLRFKKTYKMAKKAKKTLRPRPFGLKEDITFGINSMGNIEVIMLKSLNLTD